MSGLLGRFSDHTRKVFARHRSKSFLEGAMAAAALVALADGDASLEEGAEVGRLMRVLSMLKDHDPHQGVESYLRYVDVLRKHPNANGTVRKVVVDAAGRDPEAASLLIFLCHAISKADGIVRESEVAEISALANMVGVDPRSVMEDFAPLQEANKKNMEKNR